MATYYWVGGAGTWNTASNANWAATSGGTGGLVGPPTSADDAVIDTSSGTGLITCTGAVCRDLTVTASQVINLGASSSTLSVFGNLSLPSGGSFNANPNTWTITFASTTTGKTITTNGKTIPNVVFNGVGGGWTLGDALNTSTRSITLTNGTFDTSSSGNYSVTSAAINLGAGTKTLNLNASTVTLSSDGPFNFETSATNFTFNAGTSNITCTSTASNVQPRSGGFTFYNVTFTGVPANAFIFHNAGTYNNLTLPTAGGLTIISLAGNQTISGTLTLGTANTAIKRYFVRSDTLGTARTITVNGTLAALSDIDFRDITAAGTVGTWSGTRLGNCLGNTNITFDAPKTVYWNLGGSVFWYANGWAATSGGTPAVNNFPLAQDTAVFDDAGTAVSVNTNSPWNIGTIDMSTRTTAFTINFTSTSSVSLYGSLTLFSNLTVSGGTGTITFAGRGVTQTITSAGRTFPNAIIINNLTGTFQLADSFITTSTLTHTSGTFNASNQNVTATTFASNNSNTRTITMGSGTWTLSGTGTVWNLATTTGLTFNKDTANIELSNTSTTARTFAGGGRTYNNLTIGGATGTSTLTITGTNTFDTLASTKTVAHTITFPNVTTTVSNWTVTGTAGNVVTLSRTGASGTFTLAKSGGGVISGLDYLSISNSTASPTNTWYAGANSTDGGGNTNWLFTVAPVPTVNGNFFFMMGM